MGVEMVQRELLEKGVLPGDPAAAHVVSGLLPCLKENNYKVCLSAMQCLAIVLEASGDVFKPFLPQFLDLVTERTGDSKAPVRDLAVDLLLKAMKVGGVTAVLDRIQHGIAHKNYRTRVEVINR